MNHWEAWRIVDQMEADMRLQARCEALRWAMLARAKRVAHEAGIDHTLTHNALVAQHYGQPWRELDYSLVRKVAWIEQHMFDGYHLVDAWRVRKQAEVMELDLIARAQAELGLVIA